jgi:pimeloyl-ACP methyl ester carboxylesterase
MKLTQRIALKYIRTKFKLLSAISKRKAAEKLFKLFCTPQYRNRKKLPPVFERAEKLHFRFEGNTIRGYRWNHPAEKKVLILHGYESTVINFDRYITPLIKKGYEVLAFDAPAHGRSTGRTINARVYKNLVHHINTVYGPIHSYLAHSLGGLALSLFLEEIEHDAGFKAVLIAPAVETTTAVNSYFKFLKLDNELRKEFDKMIEQLAGKPTEWYSIARAAENIKASVLFLQDEDDDMTPLKDVEPIIRRNYSNFRFMITKGLGHRRIYRDNKCSKAIIEFL